MPTIRNPILRGFNPDPSILRVGGDYYVATSTFEWFPGVPIYHSRDLVNWHLIGHALTDKAHLDIVGVENSSGVWAPSLSHADGKFWLVYTIVRTRVGNFKDLKNYLVTAENILGPWSKPIFLNGSGFDPSLFHDEDGRKWLVNQQWDFRKGHSRFAGIVLQEYDHVARRLVGPVRTILTKDGLIEGPNLYKRDGRYYLMLAEGGTGWNHGISMARANWFQGLYEVDPKGFVMTTRGPDGQGEDSSLLQKAGHGELAQSATGEWYLVHLASRPVGKGGERRCILGRETCLQRVVWDEDGWLRLASGGILPQMEVAAPEGLAAHPWPEETARDDFDAPALGPHWSALRGPIDASWANLAERPGWLRLRGRESQHSYFEQSFVAKRLQHFRAAAETRLEFDPTHFTQMAGLICWYDTRTHYYLRVTCDDSGRKVLGIVLTDDGVYDEIIESQIVIDDWGQIFLRAEIDHARLDFFASPDGTGWRQIGPTLDASKLSDDYGQGLHFTGALIGLCAQDLNGTVTAADFDYFDLRARGEGD